MSIRVISPGLLTTVQDRGRFGSQEFGFSPSGALDYRALRAANLLTGNDPDEAVLEMDFMGATLEFRTQRVIALTGADMEPRLNDRPVSMYSAIAIRPGDQLCCGGAKGGMCTFLSVSGGFNLSPVMNSRSTGLKFGIGGFHGRKLQAGDELALRMARNEPRVLHHRTLPQPVYPGEATLRVVLGPQDDMFSKETIRRFFTTPYQVTDKLDRMGVRLEGAALTPLDTSDIVSDGTATGAIQIPTGGQPIILRHDRQTTGGYAKLACVITVDLPVLAQLTPGNTVRFRAIRVGAAQRLLRAEEKAYQRQYKHFNGG